MDLSFELSLEQVKQTVHNGGGMKKGNIYRVELIKLNKWKQRKVVRPPGKDHFIYMDLTEKGSEEKKTILNIPVYFSRQHGYRTYPCLDLGVELLLGG
jgi:hypothetical protein